MSGPTERSRSLPAVLSVGLVPAVAAGIIGAVAVGGSSAVVFGAVFGAILGGLAVLFAFFLSWWTHRARVGKGESPCCQRRQ